MDIEHWACDGDSNLIVKRSQFGSPKTVRCGDRSRIAVQDDDEKKQTNSIPPLQTTHVKHPNARHPSLPSLLRV